MLIRTSIAPPVRGDGSSDAESQQRVISRVEELPMSEKDFHVDRRVDSSGTPERQLTMTMPAQISDYVAGIIGSNSVLPRAQIGRAHVSTPVTNAHLVSRLLLATK